MCPKRLMVRVDWAGCNLPPGRSSAGSRTRSMTTSSSACRGPMKRGPKMMRRSRR